MQLGIDRFLINPRLRAALQGQRIAFLGHPASRTSNGQFSLDALMALNDLNIVAAFGPQHGIRGDKQDNMIETTDEIDPRYKIPIYSLYGAVRAPTAEHLSCFDVLLVDLQDLGTRVYTYITTLKYFLAACAETNKSLWILDRPNPAGRPIEGSLLRPGWESFVGAGLLVMRHGLTLGELATWLIKQENYDLDLKIIQLEGYFPKMGPGFGWPVFELAWVNPSPNASSLNMARCYAGTVLLEGTTLSEGRGTTTPLELIGAPDLNFELILNHMNVIQSNWISGALLRPCWFEPTFHKHVGKRCSGIQIHTDNSLYQHDKFKPYRLIALFLKCIRLKYPDYPLWRHFCYEYETERLAIDLISGGTFLRNWIDDVASSPEDLEKYLLTDELNWQETTANFYFYS